MAPQPSLEVDSGSRVWQSTLQLGSCSHHSAFDRTLLQADCARDARGTIRVRNNLTWMEASSDCLSHCFGCRHCNYVSLSMDRGSCMWHQECVALQHGGDLHQHGAHRAFSARVPKRFYSRWLNGTSLVGYEDSLTATARVQAHLDQLLTRMSSSGPTHGDCLHRRWLLAVGDSVLRVAFARLVEALVWLPTVVPGCFPGWRYLHHGSCDSLNFRDPCMIDVHTEHGTRLTFLWSFGHAHRHGNAAFLSGRFANKTAHALRGILADAYPRTPDVLLAGAGAWQAFDPPGFRAARVAASLDWLLSSLAGGRAATACVYVGLRFERDVPQMARLASDEQSIRHVASSRGCVYVDTAAACDLGPSDHTEKAKEAGKAEEAEEAEEAEKADEQAALSPSPKAKPAFVLSSARLGHAPSWQQQQPAANRSCAEEHCSDRRLDPPAGIRCTPYGSSACVFNGCKRGHVYGSALSRLIGAMLRSTCDAPWLELRRVHKDDTRGAYVEPDVAASAAARSPPALPAWAVGTWQQAAVTLCSLRARDRVG